jgi:hypothetical protein
MGFLPVSGVFFDILARRVPKNRHPMQEKPIAQRVFLHRMVKNLSRTQSRFYHARTAAAMALGFGSSAAGAGRLSWRMVLIPFSHANM